MFEDELFWLNEMLDAFVVCAVRVANGNVGVVYVNMMIWEFGVCVFVDDE